MTSPFQAIRFWLPARCPLLLPVPAPPRRAAAQPTPRSSEQAGCWLAGWLAASGHQPPLLRGKLLQLRGGRAAATAAAGPIGIGGWRQAASVPSMSAGLALLQQAGSARFAQDVEDLIVDEILYISSSQGRSFGLDEPAVLCYLHGTEGSPSWLSYTAVFGTDHKKIVCRLLCRQLLQHLTLSVRS